MTRSPRNINIQLQPMAGGSVLRVDGLGGWAAFELTREQTVMLRDAANTALETPPCPTLATLLERAK